MNVRGIAFGLALALGGAVPAGAAPLDLGGVRAWTAPDASARLDGVSIVVRAGLEREKSGQNGLAALAAESILHTPLDGVALRDALTARGASLSYALGPQYVRWYLEATPDAIGTAAALVARAFGAVDTSPATIGAARAALTTRITDDAANPILVGLEMLRGSFYKGGAALPVLGSGGALAQLGGDDVRGFVAAYYRRGGVSATLVGRADDAARAAAAALIAALPAGGDVPGALSVTPPAEPSKRIVTHRDVGAPYVVVGFAAPSPGSADYPAMLVLRALLGDVFDRTTSQTLPAYRRAVGTVYSDDSRPATLSLYVNGAQIDPSAAIAAIEAVLQNSAKQPLAPAVLARYRETARGEWLVAPVSLADRAWLYGNLAAQGVDPAYADGVPTAIGRVTAADVERVARTYLKHYTIALVLPRETGSRN